MLHGLKKLTQCMNNLLLGGRMALDVIGSQVRAGNEWPMLHVDLMACDARLKCQGIVRMGEGSSGITAPKRGSHEGCCGDSQKLQLANPG